MEAYWWHPYSQNLSGAAFEHYVSLSLNILNGGEIIACIHSFFNTMVIYWIPNYTRHHAGIRGDIHRHGPCPRDCFFQFRGAWCSTQMLILSRSSLSLRWVCLFFHRYKCYLVGKISIWPTMESTNIQGELHGGGRSSVREWQLLFLKGKVIN